MGPSPSFAPHSRVQKWKQRMSTVFQLSHHDPGSMTFYRFEYLWQDSENYQRPTKMPAPEYIEHLMVWVQGNIDNEAMFPSRIGKSQRRMPDLYGRNSLHTQGVPFPKTFPSLIRQLFKRLYRVYAHIYCHHYPVIIQLGLEPHLNTSFKHYVLFIDEHSLASGKDFWGPLGDLVDNMLRSDWGSVKTRLIPPSHETDTQDWWVQRQIWIDLRKPKLWIGKATIEKKENRGTLNVYQDRVVAILSVDMYNGIVSPLRIAVI